MVIKDSDFYDLVKALGDRKSLSMHKQIVYQLSKKTGKIIYRDFVSYWNDRHGKDTASAADEEKSVTSSTPRKDSIAYAAERLDQTSFGALSPPDFIHFVSFLDIEFSEYITSLDDILSDSPFIKQHFPAVKAVSTDWSLDPHGHDWNDRYQAAVDAVLAMQQKTMASVEPIETVGGIHPLLGVYFNYFATYGSFLTVARTG